jgi:hypothetical protein
MNSWCGVRKFFGVLGTWMSIEYLRLETLVIETAESYYPFSLGIGAVAVDFSRTLRFMSTPLGS